MFACVERGLARDGQLPGGLKVQPPRQGDLRPAAPTAHAATRAPAHEIMDFVSVYAMAVNEENAAGGRVVTAPTNGAAGVIPAVLRYYRDHCDGATREGLRTFLLTAAAIGALFKMNASISGAEVGCQGEVGVACSMAAAGLCAALGGTQRADRERGRDRHGAPPRHDLRSRRRPGADPLHRAQRLRRGQGDRRRLAGAARRRRAQGVARQVIATMRQTGADMQSKYKETSLGGLAVNFVEC